PTGLSGCDLSPAGLPCGSATGHGAINGRPTRPVCPEKVDSDPGFSCSAGLDAEAEGVVLAVPVGDDLHVVGRATNRAADHDLATPGFLRADRCGLQDRVAKTVQGLVQLLVDQVEATGG